ncbi:MAG: HigA family addiction module antitoxin [Lachnospiraceae bacterium]
MATKRTGISYDLLIHPGETIADILVERGITQAELAASTGVTPAYVSNIIAGKKDISAKFAFALEYALGVPKSFWLNLQANYDAELLELNENQTITDEERVARNELRDVVKYLRKIGKMPLKESVDASVLSLRKALQIRDISALKEMIPQGAFRMSTKSAVNSYVLGAWIRLCQIVGERRTVKGKFVPETVNDLVKELKNVMVNPEASVQAELQNIMGQHGIDFAVVQNFKGAPVQGYISRKQDGAYQMCVTICGSYADIFWFSVFHEIGHIVNGDISKTIKFIDDGSDDEREKAADLFASNCLMQESAYDEFLKQGDFGIEAIKLFAKQQNVMPYIVIGRLQKEKYLDYKCYSDYKIRYKWAE